jgi:hypothetical protein
MRLEVVSQLPPRQDHRVQQLLNLWVADLGLGQYLTDEVDRPLDGQCMPLFTDEVDWRFCRSSKSRFIS